MELERLGTVSMYTTTVPFEHMSRALSETGCVIPVSVAHHHNDHQDHAH
jgi:hypothetical protein